ncbi:MAG TPA: response regulator transcription factor [Negativicutes bacterium]|nr:response regulator transcription factor [Negativicutes bacterium]
MAAQRILIIEDEVKIARFLELELSHEGYEVDQAHDGRGGLEKALAGGYDLIVLDIMLPLMNGIEVLRKLRQASDVPVIMLTAKDEVMDKVIGLDMGADDYMTKPFAIEELLARIRTGLKRRISRNTSEKLLSTNGLNLNTDKYSVTFENEEIELTRREFDLLRYLMENKNIVLTRDKLLEAVWGYDYSGDTNVVDVYVRYLRSKIDEKYNRKIIHTIRGVGYTIKDGN